MQRCVWGMPWQSCTLTDKSELFTKTVNNNSLANKTKPYLNLIEAKPSIVFNGNKKLGERSSSSLFESLALSLKLKDLDNSNRALLGGNPGENRLDVFISSPLKQKDEKTKSNKLTRSEKLRSSEQDIATNGNKNTIEVSEKVEYYDSDFNVTIDDDENLEFDEQGAVQDQYAYIVVPIKISKNRKLPGLNAPSNVESTRKKNKKVTKEPKNLEGAHSFYSL